MKLVIYIGHAEKKIEFRDIYILGIIHSIKKHGLDEII